MQIYVTCMCVGVSNSVCLSLWTSNRRFTIHTSIRYLRRETNLRTRQRYKRPLVSKVFKGRQQVDKSHTIITAGDCHATRLQLLVAPPNPQISNKDNTNVHTNVQQRTHQRTHQRTQRTTTNTPTYRPTNTPTYTTPTPGFLPFPPPPLTCPTQHTREIVQCCLKL